MIKSNESSCFLPQRSYSCRTKSPCASFLLVLVALLVSISPWPVFGIEAVNLLEKFHGPIPTLDVTRLEKSLHEDSTRSGKNGYEYVLWDIAKDGSSKPLDENSMIACAIVLACTSQSSLPVVKIDVVRILQQDAYGKPRWDTAQRLGHFEIPTDRCQSLESSAKPLTLAEIRAIPSQTKVNL